MLASPIILFGAISERDSRTVATVATLIAASLLLFVGIRSLHALRTSGPGGIRRRRLSLVQLSTGRTIPLSANVRIGSEAEGALVVLESSVSGAVDVVVTEAEVFAVPAAETPMMLNGRFVKMPTELVRDDIMVIEGERFTIR